MQRCGGTLEMNGEPSLAARGEEVNAGHRQFRTCLLFDGDLRTESEWKKEADLASGPLVRSHRSNNRNT
jgi:hypothetical protein